MALYMHIKVNMIIIDCNIAASPKTHMLELWHILSIAILISNTPQYGTPIHQVSY